MKILLSLVCTCFVSVSLAHATISIGSGGGSVPIGAIFLVDSGSCPTGFTEVTALRGRYAVGTPSGGTLAGTQGAALTNLEARAAGAHTHTERVSDNLNGGASVSPGLFNAGVPQSSSIVTASTGTSTTPAPYYQVLYCIKT